MMTTTARNRLVLTLSERRSELSLALSAAFPAAVRAVPARSLYERIERAVASDEPSLIVNWFQIACADGDAIALSVFDHASDSLLSIVNALDALELRNLLRRARHTIASAFGADAAREADDAEELRVAATIDGLIAALRARDEATSIHSCQTGFLAERLTLEMHVPDRLRTVITRAATLHDIGKLGVPDTVLTKPGALNAQEWRLMQRHAKIGQEMLAEIPVLADLAPIVGAHHERLDGFGYPHGLAGEEIDFPTRVVSVVDAFHAMTSDRPYRRAMTYGHAVRLLRAGAGTQWDADVVSAMIELAMRHRDADVGADLLHLSDHAAYESPLEREHRTGRSRS